MNRSSLVHGAWCVAAITAFFLGSGLVRTGNQSPANDTRGTSATAKRRASDHGGESGGPAGSRARPPREGRASGNADTGIPAPPVLSEQDIAKLGESFRKSPNPIERRLAFSRLLEGLTPDNASQMREQIAHLSDSSSEFKEFHYAWGAIGGMEAVMHGADTKKADMAATLSGWAGADPQAAASWFNQLQQDASHSDGHKNNLAAGLVHGLSDADPELASRFVLDLAAAGDDKAAWLINIVTGSMLGDQGPGGAAAWAENLPPGPVRAGALGRVANDYARKDPQAAVAWLQSIPSSDDTSRGMQSAFSTWAGSDPVTAGEHLNQMADSSQRDWAVSGYAPRIAHQDAASGIEWVQTIDDPELRERALIRTAQVFYHQGDREAAREWLPNSGLSPEAQKGVIGRRRR